MDDKATISLLRFALAAIWTQLEHEYNYHDEYDNIQFIASEALSITIENANPGKDLTDDSTGIDSWNKHCKKLGIYGKEEK
jgi:hypothetical protein